MLHFQGAGPFFAYHLCYLHFDRPQTETHSKMNPMAASRNRLKINSLPRKRELLCLPRENEVCDRHSRPLLLSTLPNTVRGE